LTTWTARQAADRSERLAREEARRKEYRSAVIRFATALLDYRLAEMANWHARQGEAKEQEAAREEMFRARATTWNAFYELELSTNRKIADLAKNAIESAHGIRAQSSEDEMGRYSYQARIDLEKMVAAARAAQPGIVPGMEEVFAGDS
jgi:hypothetical protein